MYYLTFNHPKKLFNNIFSLYIPDKVFGDETFELIIRLTDKNISVRNLSAYLNSLRKNILKLNLVSLGMILALLLAV